MICQKQNKFQVLRKIADTNNRLVGIAGEEGDGGMN